RDRAPHDEDSLGIREHALALGISGGDRGEEVVEGPDPAREERARPLQELALDALDVRPAWHDQKRLALERGQIPVEQELDLAGVCGPDDEAERHPPIVVPGLDVLPLRKSETRGRSVKYSRGATGRPRAREPLSSGHRRRRREVAGPAGAERAAGCWEGGLRPPRK